MNETQQQAEIDIALAELVRAVARVNAQLADAWEAAAIIESLGYTDRVIAAEFGFADARALGEYVFAQLRSDYQRAQSTLPLPFYRSALTELADFLEQFSRSFVYALPWLALFIFEYARPGGTELLLPPELAAPLSLAVMLSLITSGGFIQVIARRGQFYLNLGETMLARRVCAQFLRAGLAATIICGFIALIIGFYRALFPDQYLLIAAGYYLLLNLLWLVCAVIAIQARPWRIPLLFFCGGAIFIILKFVFSFSALAAQTMATVATDLLAIIFAVSGFMRKSTSIASSEAAEMELPRLPPLLHSLLPYFSYGCCYFAFLFADRITAGSAVPAVSGLSFALDAGYKRGMDIALLNFLTSAAFAEYLNYKFMRYWYRQAAAKTSADIDQLRDELRRRYFSYCAVLLACFSVSGALLAWLLAGSAIKTALIGGLGYLCFSFGLLNAMVLFSLARPAHALKALALALVINLAIGYTLSHLCGPHYAVYGLLLASLFFAAQTCRAVLATLASPDYAYFAA